MKHSEENLPLLFLDKANLRNKGSQLLYEMDLCLAMCIGFEEQMESVWDENDWII